jgi:hypothetical protein
VIPANADAIILRAAENEPHTSTDGLGPTPRGHMRLSVSAFPLDRVFIRAVAFGWTLALAPQRSENALVPLLVAPQ